MTCLYNIKLLAFILAHKARRRSSCIYEHEKIYILSQEIGISRGAYKKYLESCRRLGLINECNAFISISKALMVLFPDKFIPRDNKPDKTPLYRASFFKNFPKKADFKYYKDLVEFSIFHENGMGQQHYNEKDEVIDRLKSNRTKGNDLDALKTLKKKHGLDSIEGLKSIDTKTEIHSGKFHLSNLLGCSPTTGANRLRRWHNEGKIEREIKKVFFIGDRSFRKFDALKAKGYKIVIPIATGFMAVMGSIITFL